MKSVTTETAADLADRRAFVLDEVAWETFENVSTGPVREVPGLHELVREPTVLDRPNHVSASEDPTVSNAAGRRFVDG